MIKKRGPKRRPKTHFDQVPLAVVKKLAPRGAVRKGRTAAPKGRA